jgi:hypothetical protein
MSGEGAGDPVQAILEAAPRFARLESHSESLNRAAAQRAAPGPVERSPNRTGLPDALKAGIETLSGVSLDDVTVRRASGAPARVGAAAYARGTEIHVAPGEDRHLAHEAWHVVQQKQGRVPATTRIGGVDVNDDPRLEREADVMAARALAAGAAAGAGRSLVPAPGARVQRAVAQRAKAISDILDQIDKIRKDHNLVVSAAEVNRLMYWNDVGKFDNAGGQIIAVMRELMTQKTPLEKKDVAENALPGFMRLRDEFSVTLPAGLGGGALWFRRRPENAIMQGGKGWISGNVYWRTPKGSRFTVHAILGFQDGDALPPNPHVTLRNAETQVKIDLDISNPLPQSRIPGAMEVTRSSYSRGLGNNEREKGLNMPQDDDAYGHLTGEEVKGWLETLRDKAQSALKGVE